MDTLLTWFLAAALGASAGIGTFSLLGLWLARGRARTLVDLGRRGRRALAKDLPESIDSIAAALSAGFSLQQAIDAAGRDHALPLSFLWGAVMDKVRSGQRLEDALTFAARQLPGTDVPWVLLSLASACRAGTNMVGSLNHLARVCRDREAVRQSILAKTAQARLQGHVLVAIPILFLLGLAVVSPASLRPVVTSSQGRSLLLAAGILQAAGAWAIRVMVRKDLI